METRAPTLVRGAILLSILVVALAAAPAVEALSAKASVRGSAKVDPEADPSSLLPTWPTGTNDPCVFVRGTGAIDVDTGSLLSQDCRSYVCVGRAIMGGATTCIVRVNPGTTELQFKVLWTPNSMADWTITAQALDFPARQQVVRCPAWGGPGSAIPPSPGALLPCNVSPPWEGASLAAIGFNAPINSVVAGSMGVYIGPPLF